MFTQNQVWLSKTEKSLIMSFHNTTTFYNKNLSSTIEALKK